MKAHVPLLGLWLVVALGAHGGIAAEQPRIEFQRQKFDRSRFERAGQPATPAPEPPPAATPAAPFGGAEPLGGSEPPAAPAALPTSAAPEAASNALPAPPPPAGAFYRPASLTPEQQALVDAPLFDQVPSKWFDSVKDFDELIELQKNTGACLLIYFKNYAVPNEKGLCNWFEKTVTTDLDWRKAMKSYLKLEINLPGNNAVAELAAKFRAGKTPAFFVVKPGSAMGTRIALFKYTAGSRPEPLEAAVVLESIKTASTPAYQGLF